MYLLAASKAHQTEVAQKKKIFLKQKIKFAKFKHSNLPKFLRNFLQLALIQM